MNSHSTSRPRRLRSCAARSRPTPHFAGAVRDCDVVGRLGGDEFAVVLVQTSWRDGLKRAQTIQWRLEQTTLDFDGHTIPLRVSIGYEAYGPEDAIDDLICRADMAMYYFKRRKHAPIAQVAAE